MGFYCLLNAACMPLSPTLWITTWGNLMNATHSQKPSTVITRLLPFAFALLLAFTGLAAPGCGVLDTNDGDDIEEVRASEANPETAGPQDIEDGDGDGSATLDDAEEGYPDGPPDPPLTQEVCTVINGREFCS